MDVLACAGACACWCWCWFWSLSLCLCLFLCLYLCMCLYLCLCLCLCLCFMFVFVFYVCVWFLIWSWVCVVQVERAGIEALLALRCSPSLRVRAQAVQVLSLVLLQPRVDGHKRGGHDGMIDCYSDNILRGLCNYVQQPLSAAHSAAATEQVMSRRERGSEGARERGSGGAGEGEADGARTYMQGSSCTMQAAVWMGLTHLV